MALLKARRYSCLFIACLALLPSAVSTNEPSGEPELNWFSSNRIQIHTAIGPSRRGGLKALEINDLVEQLGIGVYTRHVRSDWRDPFWYGLVSSTTEQKTGLKTNRQLFNAAIKDATDRGIRVGAYYWEAGGRLDEEIPGQSSGFVSNRNDSPPEKRGLPNELLCKDKIGNLIPEFAGKRIRGWHADLSSPIYRDIVLEDLLEIARFGFSSLFFDERHFPNANQSPCFGTFLEKLYRQKFNVRHKVESWDKTEVFRYVQFQAAAMADTFRYWKAALQDRGFSPLFVISGTYLSNLIFPHMSFDLARVADSVKMEYQHGLRKSIGGKLAESSGLGMADPDVRKYLAWILARDLSNGLPPYIWRQTFQDRDELTLASKEIIFHGGIVGIHVADRLFGERNLPPRHHSKDTNLYLDTPLTVIRQGIADIRRTAQLYATARPYAEVGILIDESSLNLLQSESDRWSSIAQPLQIATQRLYEKGLPFRIITDQQLQDNQFRLDYVVPVSPISPRNSDRLTSLANKGLQLLSVDGVKVKSGIRLKDVPLENTDSFQVRLVQTNDSPGVRATFNKTNDGKMLVGLICGLNSCSPARTSNRPYLLLQKKPAAAYSANDGSTLNVAETDNGKWKVSISEFKQTQLLVLEF